MVLGRIDPWLRLLLESADEEADGGDGDAGVGDVEGGEVAVGAGVDFVVLGRAAILHHDFPKQMQNDPDFEPVELPVSRDYLRSQGLGDAFVNYMAGWSGFVED